MQSHLEDLTATWLGSLDCIVLALIVVALLWDRRRLVQRLQMHIEARLATQEAMAHQAIETATTLQKLTVVIESLRPR